MTSFLRIAFCHNLKTSEGLDEAEYDTKETVDRITAALASGGHEVHPVNLNGPLSRVAGRLEALEPDIIFNTAEGRRGRLRAAFFPALFEHMGIPYTGSDAHASALTLDKHATKERVARGGVLTPPSFLATPRGGKKEPHKAAREIRYPVIAKPNYEGSSIGISSASVFADAASLEAALPKLLQEFPAGIIVEEFVTGRDITVGFLEALDIPVLDPTGYTYRPSPENPHNIYDYRLKNVASDEVEVLADPGLDPTLARQVLEWARTAARVLEIRDVGRFDFRVSAEGPAYFLEANATPSFEEGAGLLVAAAKRGVSFESLILGIIDSAARRQGIRRRRGRARQPSSRGSREPRVRRIGLTFNLKRADTTDDDTEAEFDTPKTIAGLRGALEELGYKVVELEALPDLPVRLADAAVDLVFNIAEGARGRNRESQVPALCELLDIPHTGSDAATLSLCLDKAIAKKLLVQAEVLTPRFFLMTTGKEKMPQDIRYPLIAKPNAEGTSKGLAAGSVVEDEAALRDLAKRLLARYRQPVIVEEYVAGREITVGLLGWPKPKMLAPMEVILEEPGVKYPVYHYQLKQDFTEHTRFVCPAPLTPQESSTLERAARAAFEALGCQDVARIDFRLAADGSPYLIEVNPLPGMSPGFSDLALIAEGSGWTYRQLVAEIVKSAIRRIPRPETEERPDDERIPWRTPAPSGRNG